MCAMTIFLFFIKLLLNAINAQIGIDHEVHACGQKHGQNLKPTKIVSLTQNKTKGLNYV